MDPLVTGALVGGGLDLIGGLVSQSNARSAFKSRYQDTVADMRKAGLNPALAYGQGGGNPQTSDLPHVGSSITDAYAKGASAKQALANRELTTAQANLLRAQTEDLKRKAFWDANASMFNSIYRDAHSGRELTAASVDAETARSKIQSARQAAELERLLLPEARASAKYYQGPVGRASPYINSAAEIAKILLNLRGNRR